VAERLLYYNMAIRTGIKSDGAVLNTLRTYPHKALLVRSLTVEFPLCFLETGIEVIMRATATSLCEALCHMQALTDLRIRLPTLEDDSLKALVNHVLREKHFKLRTLHCNQYLDIANIIIEHPELQTIGIYSNGDFDSLVVILEEAQAVSRLHPLKPTLFAFERDDYFPIYNNICIVPAFSADGFYPWRAITDSCDSDVGKEIRLEKSYVDGVCIYLRDLSDMTFLRLLVEEMTQNCPEVSKVTFLLQHLSQTSLDHPDLPLILSLVPQLTKVTFSYWRGLVDDGSVELSNGAQFARAQAWTSVCPGLKLIKFPDGHTFKRGERHGSWSIIGMWT